MFATVPISLPLIYVLLLLLAGLLMGLVLSQGASGDSEKLETALREMRGQNAELQESLRHHRDAYAALEHKHAEQREQTMALGELQFRIEHSLREHEVEHEGLEEGLRAIREIRNRALRDLEEERRTRVIAESQLQSANSELHRLQTQLAATTAEWERLQSNHQRQTFDREQFERIDASFHRLIGGLRSALGDKLPTLPNSEELDIQELREHLLELTRVPQEFAHTAEALRQERDEALAKLANEQQQRAALDQLLLQQEMNLKLNNSSPQLAEEYQQNLEFVSSQRDQVARALSQADLKIAELRHELDSHQRAMSVIERQRQAASERLAVIEAQSGDLQAQLHGQQELLIRFEKSQLELNSLREHNALLQGRLAELSHDLHQHRLEVKTATHQALTANQDQEALQSQLLRAQRELDRVRAERKTLADSLNSQLEEHEGLLTRTQTQSEQIQHLQVLLQSEKVDQQLLARAQDELTSLRQELHRAREAAPTIPVAARRAPSEDVSRTDELEKTIIILREQLRMAQVQVQETLQRRSSISAWDVSDHNAVNDNAQRKRFTLDSPHLPEDMLGRTRLRRQPGTDVPGAELATTDPLRSSDTQTIIHPRRGLVYILPPERPDALCQIAGIDESQQQRLNELGIYTFEQIVDWDALAIEEFSRLLNCNGQVVRDEWQGRARQLRHRQFEDQAA